MDGWRSARDGCAADGVARRARARRRCARCPRAATTRATARRDGRGTRAREGRATRTTRTRRTRDGDARDDDDERARDDDATTGDRGSGTGASAGGAARATRARETKTRERDAIEGRERDGDAREATRLEALDATTETLSFFAMAPLTLLTFPQIWKNYVNVMAGDAAALGAVSWQGYGAGMLGNLLLLSYFADKREPAATAAQAIGGDDVVHAHHANRVDGEHSQRRAGGDVRVERVHHRRDVAQRGAILRLRPRRARAENVGAVSSRFGNHRHHRDAADHIERVDPGVGVASV